jgi:hypothetical protein
MILATTPLPSDAESERAKRLARALQIDGLHDRLAAKFPPYRFPTLYLGAEFFPRL